MLEDFSVISGAGVTSSGFTVINGDVGLSPLITISGFTFSTSPGPGVVNGTVHYADLPASGAQSDALTGYNTLAGMAYLPANDLTGLDLGGMTLTPGVYHFETSAGLTGNVTLDNTGGDANSVFVIQIGSTLTAAVGSSVTILGVAPTIYWQVGSSATLNTNTDFSGNVLALASVSLGTGARLVNGRAIALTGAVTLLGNSLSSPGFVLATTGRYWNGYASALWSDENWSTTVAGTDQVALGADADVIFSVNPSPLNQGITELNGDTTISSLTVNDSAEVNIGGTDTLTISSTGLVTGININAGAGMTTISSNLELVNLPNIKVNNVDGLLISGVISGSNGMTKAGAGILALTGSNVYTGPTVVNSGTVLVGNSSAFGNGTLTFNSGLIDTYNSQSLQINVDNYEQTGGVIAMHLEGTTPGSYTQYNVAGSAILGGGAVFVYDLTGNYVPVGGDTQNILTTTAGRSGGFESDSPYSNFYNADLDQNIYYHQGDTLLYPTITYDLNNAYVVWVQDSFDSLLDLTRNQTSVSQMLDAYQGGDPADPNGVLTYLGTQITADLPGLYDLIAPDELTSIFQIGFTNAETQNLNIERHLELVRQGSGSISPQPVMAPDSKSGLGGKSGMVNQMSETTHGNQWSTFVEGTGGSASVDSDGNGSAYDFNTAGITVGADRRINDHFAIGVLGSYANTEAELTNNGRIDIDSYKGAVYATAFANGFYVDALVGAGYNEYDSKRSSLLDYSNGSTDGWELDTLINAGYDFHYNQWTISPMASIAYTLVDMNGFTETGSSTPLSYPDQSQESLRTNLGAEIAYTAIYRGMAITPQVRMSWQHEFLDHDQSIDSQFASDSGPMFTVYGPRMNADRALVSAGLSVQVTPSLCVYGYYDGQLGTSRYNSNSVSAGLKFDF